MKTATPRNLTLAALALAAVAANSPLWAHEHDDDRYFPRHATYERDHRYYGGHERRELEPRRMFFVGRPMYVERPLVIYRDPPRPYYYGAAVDERALAALALGTAIGSILR